MKLKTAIEQNGAIVIIEPKGSLVGGDETDELRKAVAESIEKGLEKEDGGRQAVTQVGKGLGNQVCPSCNQSTYYLCGTCGKCNKCCNCSSTTTRSDTEAG